MRLRVLDFGTVPPLRSQAVYHGLAEALRGEDEPILVLVRPDRPYLSVGLHQDLEAEIDTAYCRAAGLPIVRRHVGGGAVLLDADQYFFHFIYPRRLLRGPVQALYPRFIAPVLRVYRALGVAAELRPVNDIQVRGRKIGGTGAATIGEATVLVGSFLFDFDTATMARCLRAPCPAFRARFQDAMARHMTTLGRELGAPPAWPHLKARFLEAVAATLEVSPRPDTPRPHEEAAIAEAERTLADPEWTAQPGRKLVPRGVKVAAGVYLTEHWHDIPQGALRIHLLSRDGRIDRVWLEGPAARALPPDLATALPGTPLAQRPLTETLAALQLPAALVEALSDALLEAAHQE